MAARLLARAARLLKQPAHGLEPLLPRLQLSLQAARLLGGDRQLGTLLLLAREQLIPLRAQPLELLLEGRPCLLPLLLLPLLQRHPLVL